MQTVITMLGCILILGGITHAAEPVLRVSAAASLADALKEINTAFTQQTGVHIQLNLGASSTLARQIEEGAPMDVFISADLAKMDHLDAKGLLQSNTRENQLSNSLVIVTPADSALSIHSLTDLTTKTISKIATGDPKAVPVGRYAKAYLEKAGLWQSIEPKIVATENVRAALAAVESGNIDVGIVYKTDAAISKKVKVAYQVPIDPALTITYPKAALKNAPNLGFALQYLEHLDTPTSKATFTQFGFIVLPETDVAR
ncbi:molybdate ABC transporter substrate-binding protein [Phragmitibacter flavus]|uniref:Molybdate ABC transporter substrate-binding protein n=1 Tax=Phragmitibacter flavus TaxID=2576071 RepID=A0A5R8KF50_9BACT|nr:molybdate ABC transporter substrate-binding protein [Phragmitibacter flavus]TLD70881.1 molybdate ABC transporter substrate-binding protein [Phragmitibacter flavus]